MLLDSRYNPIITFSEIVIDIHPVYLKTHLKMVSLNAKKATVIFEENTLNDLEGLEGLKVN